MPELIDFETVRWKLAEDMTPEDISVLMENKDKLNDEEKAAFDNIITANTPLSDDPLDETITKTIEQQDPEPPTPEEAKPAEKANVLPENVVTQDKLESYLDTKRKEWDAEGKTKAEQKEEEKKISFELFDKGEIPADWNEAVNKFAPAIIDEAKRQILAELDRKNAEISENQQKFQQSQKEIYNRFEGEFTTLSKNKLIPDPKENPEEYKKVHAAIIKIGDENGKANVTDAYKLWSIIPEEHGGGLKLSPSKAKIDAQKEAAGKISSGRGAPGSKKGGPPSWQTIHNTRMDDLIDQRLSQGF